MFGQFPCSWILIRIPNTDLDTEEPSQCGSGSGVTTLLQTVVVCLFFLGLMARYEANVIDYDF